jgi:hypothetical protein
MGGLIISVVTARKALRNAVLDACTDTTDHDKIMEST